MELEYKPEYYDVIPEFNRAGRLCNYHTGGDGETVRVMAEEWERFNQLAGRQHEVVDGIVIYNPDLTPCMPDLPPDPPTLEDILAENERLQRQLTAQEMRGDFIEECLLELSETVYA